VRQLRELPSSVCPGQRAVRRSPVVAPASGSWWSCVTSPQRPSNPFRRSVGAGYAQTRRLRVLPIIRARAATRSRSRDRGPRRGNRPARSPRAAPAAALPRPPSRGRAPERKPVLATNSSARSPTAPRRGRSSSSCRPLLDADGYRRGPAPALRRERASSFPAVPVPLQRPAHHARRRRLDHVVACLRCRTRTTSGARRATASMYRTTRYGRAHVIAHRAEWVEVLAGGRAGGASADAVARSGRAF
jgi:hypothetical protein